MPNGASDTCCYYFFFFFFCPSGLWIPALIFFFTAQRGAWWMEIWFCELLHYLEYLCLLFVCTVAADRLVLCEWTYGLEKTTLRLNWVGVQGVESPRPPLWFLRDTAILEPVTPRIRTLRSTADWIEATNCAALAKGFLYMCGVAGFALICGSICGVVRAGSRKPRSARISVRCCAEAAED